MGTIAITWRLSSVNFSHFKPLRQSEHIIGPDSHVKYPTGTKNRNFVEDHPKNIHAKLGSNWPREARPKENRNFF
jgi:hypothetical protein